MLFDFLYSEYPLPDTVVQDDVFCTESFDSKCLDSYFISHEGRLFKHEVEYVEIPEEDRPFAKHPDFYTNHLLRLSGSIKAIDHGQKFMADFFGSVIFYLSLGDRDAYEYEALFGAGILLNLKKLSGPT